MGYLLISLYRNSNSSKKTELSINEKSNRDIADLAIDFFNSNLYKNMSAEKVRKHVNVSSSTLKKAFKKKTGMSPSEYSKSIFY